MKFHCGHTEHAGCLSFFHGTIIIGGLPNQECFFGHPIKWWFGFSLGAPLSFFGLIRLDGTREYRAEPGTAAKWGFE